MLGRLIADPEGVEGKAGSCAGLGYLEIETVLMPSKTVRQIEGVLLPSGASVCGYEIHAGASFGPGLKHPFVRLSDGRFDGARSKEGWFAERICTACLITLLLVRLYSLSWVSFPSRLKIHAASLIHLMLWQIILKSIWILKEFFSPVEGNIFSTGAGCLL